MKTPTTTMRHSILLVFFLFTGILFSQSAQYSLTGKIIIGGETRWDYLSIEESTNRLFVSHGAKVHVINLSDDKLAGEITELTGVHGIAFVPEFNKGYISNRDGQITVFDLKTLKKTGNIKIDGKNPDAIIYDSFSKRIYTMNHSSNSVTVIDPQKDEAITTIAIEGVPEAAASDNNGRIFVNLEDKSAINVIDTKTLKVTANWPIAPCSSPTGMAIDLKNKRLFTVGDKKMAVLDINSGKVLAALPIGGGCDGCVFDPQTNLLFSSNGEGTMTIIKEETPDTFKEIATIPTQKGARTITIDYKTHRVFSLAVVEEKGTAVKNFCVLIIDRK
jgi:YVTN family beta-propeller protein